MSWLNRLLRFEGEQSAGPDLSPATGFIYVRLPVGLQPRDRFEQFEDAIDEALEAQGAGYVSGGGTLMSEPDDEGVSKILAVGIDIEAQDVEAVRRLLRAMLPQLGAPHGTQIEFTIRAQRLQDRLTAQGWVLDEHRTDLHPGFDL